MNDEDRNRTERTGPIGTVLGASLGTFGAAVGAVVDEDRFAFTFSVGTNADEDDGMADATTIEIEDADGSETNEGSADETSDDAVEEADRSEN